VLRRANRRGVEEKAARIQSALRAPALRQPTQIQAAFAAIVTSQVWLITALNGEIAELGEVVVHHFGRHRDAEIYISQPSLGVILGARQAAADLTAAARDGALSIIRDDDLPGPRRRGTRPRRYRRARTRTHRDPEELSSYGEFLPASES